jgi:CrcB protein
VLVANVSGCLVAGLVFVLLSERPGVDPLWRLLVAVGFLGAFTTFSAFSVDTLVLMQSGQLARAAVNVLANLVLCLGACGLGMWLARQL